ncbi:hypothetical protein CO174_01125 [Candidatus Uhrbacteria bacterium CG_4_9_14_3_um_filter_50_9]|uniref:Rod shape-determining protein MreD n=1 Tax=Candidatus Uhrbacteria bacterium CG_4_9_14_3_um_filter_50_9 TaxID=1975035 RepID=A0A2M7XDV4_9BACT|nr:MAG: hypothetical protein CO174_01125 [Candidatus Uhrbacteria bacterium CG_4_9_14_3_um_filter_50_9]
MTRILWFILLFILLTSLELAFISSLPFPFSAAPLVITLSILRLQAQNDPYAIGWIILYGILLDLFRLHTLPFATLAYAIAAVAALIMSRLLFSNRSFYGVLGTTVSVLIVLSVTEILTLFATQLTDTSIISLEDYFSFTFWRMIGATVLLLFFFPLQRSFVSRIHSLF